MPQWAPRFAPDDADAFLSGLWAAGITYIFFSIIPGYFVPSTFSSQASRGEESANVKGTICEGVVP